MCAKKGSGKSAGTPLSFRPGDMNYVQPVDVVFLEPVKNKRGTTWGCRLSGKPYGVSQRL